jgi:hypothetical protein
MNAQRNRERKRIESTLRAKERTVANSRRKPVRNFIVGCGIFINGGSKKGGGREEDEGSKGKDKERTGMRDTKEGQE